MGDEITIGPWTLEEYQNLTVEEISAHYSTGDRDIDFNKAKYIQHLLNYKHTLLELEGDELLARKKELDQAVRFLNKVLQALNDASDKKTGEVNVKGNSELQKLIKEAEAKNAEANEILSTAGKEMERVENLRNAANQRIQEAEKAEEEGDFETANALREKAEELNEEANELEIVNRTAFDKGNLLKDTAKPVLRLKEFDKLNKENRQYIVENTNSMIGELDTMRRVTDQQLSDLNQKRNTFAMYCKMIAQTLHSVMVAPAKNIR